MMMRRIVSMITCCPALASVNRRAGVGVDLVGCQLVGKLVRGECDRRSGAPLRIGCGLVCAPEQVRRPEGA